MKIKHLMAQSILLALGLVAVGTMGQVPASQVVNAASNIFQTPVYSERSNAVLNTRGVKGIENNHYTTGNATPKAYKVIAGTQAGSQWHTAFYLPSKTVTSANNPSGKKVSYFANAAPQGYTIDDAGNMYFAISRRNSNGASTGFMYQGYIMRIDAAGVNTLIKQPTLLRTNPNALGNHLRFSLIDGAFSSGGFAFDPATQKLKFFVAFNYGNKSQDQFLAKRPVQLATVNPNSLVREKTDSFYMYDRGSGHYNAASTLAFDRSGNFYTAAAASLTTTNGQAYILNQGQRSGNSYVVRQLGMSIKPVLANQLQGISIDHNRMYIASNSAYLSFDLNAYLSRANTPSAASSANSWMGLEVNQLAGARESENTVGHNGVKYMMMTTPNEVVMSKTPAPSNQPSTSGVQKMTGVVQIHYVKGYGIAIWAQPGKHPLTKKLAHGTSWKVFAKTTLNGKVWYNLGGNQWLDSKYAILK